jgi:hypothetical protein
MEAKAENNALLSEHGISLDVSASSQNRVLQCILLPSKS